MHSYDKSFLPIVQRNVSTFFKKEIRNFNLYAPSSAHSPEAVAKVFIQSEAAQQIQKGNKTILSISAEEFYRTIAQESLSENGYSQLIDRQIEAITTLKTIINCSSNWQRDLKSGFFDPDLCAISKEIHTDSQELATEIERVFKNDFPTYDNIQNIDKSPLLSAFVNAIITADFHDESVNPDSPDFYVNWAAHALVAYQWYTGRKFQDILDRIPFSEFFEMAQFEKESTLDSLMNELNSRYERNAAFECSGKKMKALRKARGITIQELATKTNISEKLLNRYEKGIENIDDAPGRLLFRIAHVLQCHIKDLLFDPSTDR